MNLAELIENAQEGWSGSSETATRAPAFLNWRELAGKIPPPRDWAIPGWLGFGHVTLLAGVGGIGKTLLAEQIASALALGRNFIGEVREPLTVLGWFCEDDGDELWRRQLQIANWMGVELDAFADRLHFMPRLGLENELVGIEYGKLGFSTLLAELREQALDLDARIVILDNVAQLYGGSENDRHQVTVFLNALTGALPGCALLILAHPSRAQGSEFSGSSAWEAIARTRLYLGDRLPDQKAERAEEAPQDDVRYLSRRKANYSEKDWRRFTYRDHVLVPDEIDTQGGIVGVIRARNAERAVLAGFRRLQEMGMHPTSAANSPRYLPKLLAAFKLAEGNTKEELGIAMRESMLADKMRQSDNVAIGPDRHRISGLQLVE